ncbi:MAG: GntR family transcriptional regulator [Microbacteriaceae bacterium]|nr:GntR family transcriptional regulator [Microbacteriaceae bacterium]
MTSTPSIKPPEGSDDSSWDSSTSSLSPIGKGALSDTHMLSEQVYRSILQLVTRGQLQHGARLRIEVLSRVLNVSPTPVREGLARLEATGLVVHLPHKGFRIAPPLTAEQLEHLMDARELLEVGAAGAASAAGGQIFVDALERALSKQREAVLMFHVNRDAAPKNEDAAWAVIDADLDFHHVVFEHTENPFIGLMAGALNGQAHRVRQYAEKGVSDDFEALNEHDAILVAARTLDPVRVQEAMRAHIHQVRLRARADMDPA